MKALQNLRRKVGAMIGGFEGGLSARRLKTFAASRAHVNTLIQAAGADMTARARYLIRNNGYAANAVESWAGNAVGTGIKPSSGIADAVLKAVQKTRPPMLLRYGNGSRAMPLLAALVPSGLLQKILMKRFGLDKEL